MGVEELTTRQLIIDAGKNEFLSKGFLGASLRNIAKNANVTTGAFYGYFDGKEELFSTIVEPCASAVKCRFSQTKDSFFELPQKRFNENGVELIDCIDWLIDYMYDHYDEFKILLCCADGTRYESFVHDMVEIEVNSTFEIISQQGQSLNVDRELCHMICSGMFGGIFELIEHDMSREKAKPFVNSIRQFNHAGWINLIEG